jgi:hypothetical protein
MVATGAAADQLMARVPIISAAQKGPVVNLISWIAMTTACLAVVTVFISKRFVIRRLSLTDLIICGAVVGNNRS